MKSFRYQSHGFLLLLILLYSFPSLYAADAQQRYCIKEGYISRLDNIQFDDTGNHDEYQDEVYLAAQAIAEKYHYTTIADVGCGSGFKLMKYFRSYKTVGFEIQPTLGFLLRKYPDKHWEISDFGKSLSEKQFDLIICADVIEHLIDPNQLLEWLQECNFGLLVISTPDRDRLLDVQNNNPQSQTGPPVNPAHVREWGFGEFASFIGQYFEVISHFHTEREYWGQVIVVKKRTSE